MIRIKLIRKINIKIYEEEDGEDDLVVKKDGKEIDDNDGCVDEKDKHQELHPCRPRRHAC